MFLLSLTVLSKAHPDLSPAALPIFWQEEVNWAKPWVGRHCLLHGGAPCGQGLAWLSSTCCHGSVGSAQTFPGSGKGCLLAWVSADPLQPPATATFTHRGGVKVDGSLPTHHLLAGSMRVLSLTEVARRERSQRGKSPRCPWPPVGYCLHQGRNGRKWDMGMQAGHGDTGRTWGRR